MMISISPLQQERIGYKPKIPPLLEKATLLVAAPIDSIATDVSTDIQELFPLTSNNPLLSFKELNLETAVQDDKLMQDFESESLAMGADHSQTVKTAPVASDYGSKDCVNLSSSTAVSRLNRERTATPLRVGVVLSGGQAPGGNNVIAGLFDTIKKIHPDSTLIGFYDGPNGLIENKTCEITATLLKSYRNQGGFDILGSGRIKIETQEQLASAEQTVTTLGLNGLVIVGGDDSNTNAAFLAEYFKKQQVPIMVVGVPKTIDGDLRNEYIEISFGFDSACKVYSESIGNVCKDALSSKKYYFFVKLMGRSASHITLECALKTQPNQAFIGEEIAASQLSLKDVVQEMVSMIINRSALGKDYGVILIPEGLIEFIPEIKVMLQELSSALVNGELNLDLISKESAACFKSLPKAIQDQLLLDRDPHGNIQVSKIETERLFIELVQNELKKQRDQGFYKGKFNAQPLFFGYEGRSGLPSNFDCDYTYTLGCAAAHLLNNQATGYMVCVKNLSRPHTEWEALGVPIYTMLHLEQRGNKTKAVIKKTLVDLSSDCFKDFQSKRKHWLTEDVYLSPGPIQFFGPSKFTDSRPLAILPKRNENA
jgi:pyrophosphate--fructose-6-phosphate 1-phosphotransferase